MKSHRKKRTCQARPARRTIVTPVILRVVAPALLLVVLLVILLAAAGGLLLQAHPGLARESRNPTLTVAWWGTPARHERTRAVLALYQEDNPGTDILAHSAEWGDYWHMLDTLLAAPRPPQVIQQDYAYLHHYVQEGALLPLDEFLRDGTITLPGVPDPLLEGGRLAGHLYGIPLGINAPALAYDPEALARAGVPRPTTDWTWDDFARIARQVHQETGLLTRPIFSGNPRVGFDTWLRQRDRSFFSSSGRGLGFSDPALLEDFWTLQRDLAREGLLAWGGDSLVEGRSWVEFIWSNAFPALQEEARRPLELALMPRITHSRRPGLYLKPAMFFSLARAGENPRSGARFLSFFLTHPGAARLLDMERGVPLVPAVHRDLRPRVTPAQRQVLDYIALVADGHSSPLDAPDPPGGARVQQLFRETTSQVLEGLVSPSRAAREFLARAERELFHQFLD
ncbi:multiple sugar transport system substrate-binding protein [Alkalispirochaeta americana]|uniref:Multiple sugar transport system substrate-binding protein n=1 Tax=Alkalispirochaeta americana TaxID=159291 RepID=A0A1N6S1J6_9SPIO|nr:extracellular solute-binding protein [Alkalispirochaeta americana]SIQ34940.1 multiple sugar transport system substrate-binding protein [Alkalispirochaeta americana]